MYFFDYHLRRVTEVKVCDDKYNTFFSPCKGGTNTFHSTDYIISCMKLATFLLSLLYEEL